MMLLPPGSWTGENWSRPAAPCPALDCFETDAYHYRHMRRWNPATAVMAAASAGLVAMGGALYALQAQQAPAPPSTSPPHLTLVDEYLCELP